MGFLKDLFKADPEVDFQLALREETFNRNLAKAAWLYSKASDKNHPKAQYYLGHMYLFGRGVPQDTSKALQLLYNSSSQGYHKADYLLSQMFLKGIGVNQDKDKGNHYLELFKSKGYNESDFEFIINLQQA